MTAMQDGMPNCTAYENEFDYRHNINDDQYLIYAVGELHKHFFLAKHIYCLCAAACIVLFCSHCHMLT